MNGPGRRTRSAVLSALALAVVTAGAMGVPPATGRPAASPRVVEVTTDTPSSELPPAGHHSAGAPVYPGPYRVTQPDGTPITLMAWGDSRTSGYRTRAGYAVTRDDSGVWRYAVRRDAAGRPVPSRLVVGTATPPPAARGLGARAAATSHSTRGTADRGPGTGNGPQPALVILVSFADQASVGTTEDQWATDFFGSGSTVAGYYQATSFGKFALTPAAETGGVPGNGVVGWLQLPYDHPDFGSDYGPSETKLGVDAVKAANPYVDYASFDTDRNGVLSRSELHVTVIVAGYETSYGGSLNVCGPSVWGHEGGLYAAAPRLDGTVVDRNGGTMFGEYMCTPSDAPGHMSTIGIMAHEIGHDIGLPDLYDTDYSSSGIAGWSLMSGGSWNSVGAAQPGTTPAGLDAFSKSYQGWITPTPVVGAITGAALPAAATSPTAYRLGDNPDGVDWKFLDHRGTGEYFLVENRQPVGFDAGLPACGVVVYHVDEHVRSSNEANADETHRLVDVEEADGTTPMDGYPYAGSPADVFPGSSGHLDFNDTSLPAASLYSGSPSGAAMHVDGGCADTMSANLSTPLPNDAFASATRLPGTHGSLPGANNGATKEPDEPAVAANPGGASIWYRFRAPASGRLRLTTAGSAFDTLLGLYRGTTVSALSEVASNDNATPTTPSSSLSAKVRRGVTYAIAVDGQNLGAGAGQGASVLTYRYHPANDRFAQATRLSGGKGKKVSSSAGAGRERREPRRVAARRAGASVWYTYRATSSGRLTVDLSGSRFDPLLGVYTGAEVAKLHRVAADDNGGAGRDSRVSFGVTRGTTYRILVAGVSAADGRFVLRWHR